MLIFNFLLFFPFYQELTKKKKSSALAARMKQLEAAEKELKDMKNAQKKRVQDERAPSTSKKQRTDESAPSTSEKKTSQVLFSDNEEENDLSFVIEIESQDSQKFD